MNVWEPLIDGSLDHQRSDEGGKQHVISFSSSKYISSAIEENFITLIPRDERIERVFWAFETHMLRIWTVIDRPDFEFEKKIYTAQLNFMDLLPEVECDFSVIYRFGKSFDNLKPTSAIQIFPR